MSRSLRIDVEFDLICPWCLIGLRQLDRALALLHAAAPDVVVDLHWRGVQLLPQVPAAGYDFQSFYRQRLGSDAAIAQRQAQVRAAADAAGAVIDYTVISVMPNTADAHRLLDLAAAELGPEAHRMLLERLLLAYFEQGANLGGTGLLQAHASACGMSPALSARAFLGAAVPRPSMGSGRGVPLFCFDGQLMVSGAQPHTVLLQAMLDAIGAAGSAHGAAV